MEVPPKTLLTPAQATKGHIFGSSSAEYFTDDTLWKEGFLEKTLEL